MPTPRRQFIRQVSAMCAGAALPLPALAGPLADHLRAARPPDVQALARDEAFWQPIQRAFVQSPHFINLENGYFSPVPEEVLNAHLANVRMINETPSFYMRRRQTDEREALKKQLADLAGVSANEVVVTRNATEALEALILGLPMQRGDEAVISDQDYPNMVEAFRMRARREGIVVRTVALPLHPQSDAEVVQAYERALTPRTRVLLATHLINLTGQVLPVKQLCDLGRARGVDVIVDAAHSFAHLDYRIPDLGCDYLGTSLHKWLSAPLGSGLLYIKQEKIAKVQPLFGDVSQPDTDIRKFERVGTQPCANHLAIANAIRFHELIGAPLKEARLRYLKDYWAERMAKLPGVYLNMPLAPARSGGLGNVGVAGKTPAQLADYLYDHHRIFTVAIDSPPVRGIRVTPHLYTTLGQLDKFVAAMAKFAGG
jgi:selenocysteine lyase/cysteine desulfurase